MNKLTGGRVAPSAIPQSGPAPVLIRYTDLLALTPDWERVTAAIEADPDTVKQLDWVREMYAWDIAVALHNVSMVTETPPHSRLIAQPPHDLIIGDAAMLHYTWWVCWAQAKGGTELYGFTFASLLLVVGWTCARASMAAAQHVSAAWTHT